MMKSLQLLLVAVLVLCVCSKDKKAASCPMDKSMTGRACQMSSSQMQAAAPGITGVVVEAMGAAGYTYVLVDTGKAKVWAVGPQIDVKPGDTVVVSGIMPMPNYTSKSLHRTFDLVYFAGSISHKGQQTPGSSTAPSHGMMGSTVVPLANMDFSGIKKPPQGKTIAEIFVQKDELAGKKVVFAGLVVKATFGILGKNWLHIQDGTGATGTNDITVTTQATCKPGQSVVVEGILSKDKDIGAGYKYTVLIENANVTVTK
jgi:hypothetical protein